MPVKIRLSRQGKKGSAFYHIVAADSRAPRDGKFIERLGSYNPNTNPATIEINFEKALTWMLNGAQPTDTCRAILSYKGILMKKHLLEGVKKGALTMDAADARFEKWLSEKENQIETKKSGLKRSKDDDRRARMAAETKIKEAKAQEIAKKIAALNAKAAVAEVAEEAETEAPVAEATEPQAAE